MKNPIELLKSQRIQTINEYNQFTENHPSLFLDLPREITIIPKGTIIFRVNSITRQNWVEGSKSNLSYRPHHIPYDKFNRCSLPNQSIFYGSRDYNTAIFEKTIFNDLNNNEPSEHLEIGEWHLTKDILAAIFIQSENNKYKDNLFNENTAFHNNKLLYEFICDEFSKSVNETKDYWISAAYSNFLFSNKMSVVNAYDPSKYSKFGNPVTVDAIIYNSLKMLETDQKILDYNFAIHPRVIDQNLLILKKALIIKNNKLNDRLIVYGNEILYNNNISGDTWKYLPYKAETC